MRQAGIKMHTPNLELLYNLGTLTATTAGALEAAKVLASGGGFCSDVDSAGGSEPEACRAGLEGGDGSSGACGGLLANCGGGTVDASGGRLAGLGAGGVPGGRLAGTGGGS